MGIATTKKLLICGAALASFAMPSAVWAQQRNFDLPSQAATQSIPEFARQAGVQIVAPGKTLRGITTRSIKGEHDVRTALRLLLQGTGIQIIADDGATITLGKAARGAGLSPGSGSSQSLPVSQPSSGAPVTAGAEPADPEGAEIIVTAQKREERLQEVPVPVTVLSAQSLATNNLTRIQDYYARVPGLNFSTGYRGDPYVVIRGVTTTGAANPTVGFVVDDVPFGSSSFIGGGASAPDIDPSDLERVEILRGPQGTLYGASSIGGLIKYVTVKPTTRELSGQITAGLSTVDASDELGFAVRGSVNVPLNEKLAVRASGFFRRDPGYIDDPVNGIKDTNRRDVGGGRAALLWQASDELSVTLSALVQRQDADGAFFSDPALGDLKRSAVRGTGGYQKDIASYAAAIEWSAGKASVTSITSYGINRVNISNDLSLFYSTQANTNFGVRGVEFVERNRTDKFTQELRVALPLSDRITWRVGGFYTNEDTDYEQQYFAEDPAVGTPVGQLLYTSFPSTFSEYAIFSDMLIGFGERFDVQLGGRYSVNRQSYSQIETGPLVPGEVIQAAIRSKDDSFTYLVVPRFRVSPDFMIYGRFASGYRPGGPNLGARRYGLPLTVDADTTQNYELGVKGNLAGRALSYEASIYRIDWKDVQVSFRDPITAFSFLTNAGRARITGAEASVTAKPWRGMTVVMSAAYTDAELAENLPPGSSIGGLEGDRLPNSPKFAGSISADQTFPLSDEMMLSIGGTVSHIGDRTGVFRANRVRQIYPDYTTVDLRAGVEYATWKANLFVNNVTNRRGVLSGGIGNIHPTLFNYIQPRTIGLSITKSF